MSFHQVIDFLRDLNNNNSKEWMDEHRDEYEKAKGFLIDWVEELNGAIAQVDDSYEPTPGKKAISRINNNLLYHPNLPTYKDHFGISLKQLGGKSAFYIQIGTQKSFIGGGFHRPNREVLNNIREEIAETGDQLKRILNSSTFEETFGDLKSEEQLKTAPQGYSTDHEHIDLLRMKGYTVDYRITQEDIKSDDFIDIIVSIYQKMMPLSQYLNAAAA